MSDRADGACQCGAVRFFVSGQFEGFFLCHCARCRKDAGSAHAANLFSTSATVTWLSGEDHIKTYRVPETRHEKSFCRECGAALPGIQMDGAVLVVPAGCLDTPVDIRPNAHICIASRANWDEKLNEILQFEGLPDQPIASGSDPASREGN